jgi:ketosteroid isomerase-like protein
MSTEEKNKALVCRFLEAQAKGDLEALTQEIRERVEHELQVARDIQLASLPEGMPTLEDWRSTPTASLPGRWEETSTSSTSSVTAGWASLWGTLRAREYLLP